MLRKIQLGKEKETCPYYREHSDGLGGEEGHGSMRGLIHLGGEVAWERLEVCGARGYSSRARKRKLIGDRTTRLSWLITMTVRLGKKEGVEFVHEFGSKRRKKGKTLRGRNGF